MNDIKNALTDLLAYSDKDPQKACELMHERFSGFLRMAQIPNVDVCSSLGEMNTVLLKVVAALASRRVTESFKFGREYDENEFCKYVVSLYLGTTDEAVYFFPIDEKGRLNKPVNIGGGSLSSSVFLPRKILEAMVRCGVVRGVVAHNHPYGNPNPSSQDLEVTKQMTDLMLPMGKEIIAHYVVADDQVFKIDPKML
ncbi:MAG: hypothetical protein J6Q68_02520 [Clostridia bacterium]|nr:hypothetical protein [Clostridia bacterium]